VTDETSSLKDDISFLRSLAELGRDRPLGGGVWLVAGGAIFGSAALISWLEMTGLLAFGIPVQLVWLGALVLAFGAHWLLSVRFGGLKAAGPSTRAFAMAWSGVGIGILVLALVNALAFWRYQNSIVLALEAPTYICLYGIAWFVSSALVRRWWFLGVAIACFAFSIVLVLLPYPTAMLGFAVAIICTAFMPGVYLMTGESH
jgi:hypothetical protein